MADSERLFTKKDIFRLVFPIIAELSLTLTVGMIDSVMVASVGEAAVSGVSLIDTVFQLLIYIFAAFGTGGAVVAGQYLGAKLKKEANETAEQLIWFSALVSVGITVFVYLIREFLLGVVFGRISEEVYYNANRYLLITALSIPALSVYESGAAIFRTMGNTKITMLTALMMNIINCGGNGFFIYFCGFGSAGAAFATTASRYAAAAIMLVLLMNPENELSIKKTLYYRPNGRLIYKILSIGVPNGVENGLFQSGKIILASLITSFGTSAITANAVCQTLANIQVIPGNAIALAATTVIARSIGLNDPKQAKYFNRLLLKFSYAALFIFCGIIWLLLTSILSWYHLSDKTLELTRQMVFIHTFGTVILWSLTFILPASMRAAGDVKFPMFVSIISMWIFRVMSAYLLANNFGFGAVGVWLAMLMDWLFRAVVFSLRWISGRWQNYKVI